MKFNINNETFIFLKRIVIIETDIPVLTMTEPSPCFTRGLRVLNRPDMIHTYTLLEVENSVKIDASDQRTLFFHSSIALL